MIKSDIGLVGLAVMGENLALNLEQKGYRVSLYNRLRENSPQAVDSFLANKGKNKHFIGTHSPKEFIESLKSPRKILLMIRAGHPVDEMITTLLPFLKKGDTIIDGGNSDYRDTQRRENELREKRNIFCRLRYFGRRRRSSPRAIDYAGRIRRNQKRNITRFTKHSCASRRRDSLLLMDRARRFGTLRKNSSQRYRIRRYATDSRGIFSIECFAKRRP